MKKLNIRKRSTPQRELKEVKEKPGWFSWIWHRQPSPSKDEQRSAGRFVRRKQGGS